MKFVQVKGQGFGKTILIKPESIYEITVDDLAQQVIMFGHDKKLTTSLSCWKQRKFVEFSEDEED